MKMTTGHAHPGGGAELAGFSGHSVVAGVSAWVLLAKGTVVAEGGMADATPTAKR